MLRVLAISVTLVISVAAGRQMWTVPESPGWVGLYSNSLIGWLENENQLDRLCAASGNRGAALDACRAEQLQPKPFVVPLTGGPSRSAQSRGQLLLLASPGKGLRFFYVAQAGGTPLEFEPDLILQDWGYGPYFHQTFLARKGDWFQLPEQPFPAETWFNARDLGDPPHTRTIEVGEILDSPEGSIVVLGIDREGLDARPEQPADMWCDSGQPPVAKPWQAMRIPWKALYTPTGHLRLSLAYPKGC